MKNRSNNAGFFIKLHRSKYLLVIFILYFVVKNYHSCKPDLYQSRSV